MAVQRDVAVLFHRGNTMKTQSCSQPQLGPKITVEKLRAGFTDVLSIGIVIMWTRASMSPIGSPAKPAMADERVVPRSRG